MSEQDWMRDPPERIFLRIVAMIFVAAVVAVLATKFIY